MSTRPTQTIHSFVEGILKRTKQPYAQIALTARRKFKSSTTPASVRHYASKMRQAGVKLPDRPVAREAEFV